jgi:hypothetical protein
MTSKIYKITGSGLTYYGSTSAPLGTRKSQHNYDYNAYLKGKARYISVYDIIEKGEYKMEIVEDNIEKDQLLIREGFYIQNNECVNKRVAGRTSAQYYKDNEEKMKSYKSGWSKDNRERLKEKYHDNKDKINELRRQRQQHPDVLKKKKEEKEARGGKPIPKSEAQKEYNNKRVKCPICNKEYNNSSLSKHIKNQHPS